MLSSRSLRKADIPSTVVEMLNKICPPEFQAQLRILKDHVLLVSAKEALMARQVAVPDPSADVQAEYAQLVFAKKCVNFFVLGLVYSFQNLGQF